MIVSVVAHCSFFTDFGPLNIASLYRYCCKLNKKLKVSVCTCCTDVRCVSKLEINSCLLSLLVLYFNQVGVCIPSLHFITILNIFILFLLFSISDCTCHSLNILIFSIILLVSTFTSNIVLFLTWVLLYLELHVICLCIYFLKSYMKLAISYYLALFRLFHWRKRK